MTSDELRQIDYQVAKKVMSLELDTLKSMCHLNGHQIGILGNDDSNSPYCYTCFRYWGPNQTSLPWDGQYRACNHYSTQITYAWQVVEKMNANGWLLELEGPVADFYIVFFTNFDGARVKSRVKATEDTASLAICLAALKAL